MRSTRQADPAADWARQWEVVTSFYMAVHWVDQGLADVGTHPPSHRQRGSESAVRWPGERLARRAFQDLWRLAELVRYEAYVPTHEELQAVDAALRLVLERLE